MSLTLTIENVAALPDGGPLSVSLAGRRGLDIGRDQYLDWTLPDPDRAISGKHAELRHRDGGYWLQDVSRNGTFLNRNPQRLQEAHRLKDGDRIQIGRYVILVRIDGEAAAAVPPAPALGVTPGEYWDPQGAVPPPIPSRDLRPPAALRPVKPDFIDWAVDLPGWQGAEPAPRREAQPEDAMDWARATPPPAAPLPPPMPTPRRPHDPAAAFPPPREADPPHPEGRREPEAFREPDPSPGDSPWGAPAPRIAASEAGPRTSQTEPRERREVPRPPDPIRDDVFVQRFAAGLGISPDVLAWQDPGDLAQEAGALLRFCAENLKQLLAARAESKRAARATSQTMIQALDNNPLKFAPTVDDALRIMMGRPSSGYLTAERALDASFRDLKTHQVKTYAAMQNALRLLIEDLGPEGVEASDEKDRGLGGLLGSRKARLWDIYTTRWDALASPHEDGLVDAFMLFFSDCYDNKR
ncbi:type VI secretion system-associated FHA domain protein TagH [Methylobacterium sp. BTF04]|uniref:type VI secretion system-associated FHA domain protein TagH n=1 Tax=Methylobacterium sp. BTF04 TaxID=2708300 RepID=UPI0013D6B8AA|nr:type VI secretion system-associated FHA domain protein TagH [Methylobacterium sp. BTF04]NEU11880.1 type VI secretion system-associated FHA domain protein TagH [Methylobacterium sp. BTF04]